jgi:hypothetical protein
MQSQVSPTLAKGPSVWKANLDRHDLELGWYQKREPTKHIEIHACADCDRYAAQAVLLTHRETGLPAPLGQLLRPLQPRGASHDPQEADGVLSDIRGDAGIRPAKGWLRGRHRVVVEPLLVRDHGCHVCRACPRQGGSNRGSPERNWTGWCDEGKSGCSCPLSG